jgi:hypothetical protein
MKLRKWILKIHLYGGLIYFWYLIILSISSLNFQHHFNFLKNEFPTREAKNISLVLPELENNYDLATNIQNKLGIIGWYLPWETYYDSVGIFHVQIQNPYKHYLITYDSKSSTASVIKEGNGFWNVINVLHGFAEDMPNAPFLIFWKMFTYICLGGVIFSIFSGIWLWQKRSRNKLIGWLTILGIMGLSILLMIVVFIMG